MNGQMKVHPGQKWIKRVIAEMGGKDTVVVDNDADLDLICFKHCLFRFRFFWPKMFGRFSCSYSSGCL